MTMTITITSAPSASAPITSARYLPVRPMRFTVDAFAARSGLHPELLHRFVALGLLDADTDAAGRLWFSPADLRVVARIQRLRTGLALNYAAIGLVMDLLDQIDRLHAASRPATREELIHSGR